MVFYLFPATERGIRVGSSAFTRSLLSGDREGDSGITGFGDSESWEFRLQAVLFHTEALSTQRNCSRTPATGSGLRTTGYWLLAPGRRRGLHEWIFGLPAGEIRNPKSEIRNRSLLAPGSGLPPASSSRSIGIPHYLQKEGS